MTYLSNPAVFCGPTTLRALPCRLEPMSKALSEYYEDKLSHTTGKGQERLEEILRAAQHLLAAEGYSGLTMRSVANSLGVSLSTVQHYFKNKDTLVQAVLTYVMDNYQAVVAELMNTLGSQSQLERFQVIVDMVIEEIRRPETYGILAEIYALANRLPFAARLMESVYARERKEVFKLIVGINPALSTAEYKLRAAMIVVQIHGLATQLVGPQSGLTRKQLEEAARQSFLRLATQA